MTHVHTIPVDPSLTTDEAWRELCIFGRRVTVTGRETWAHVSCDGEQCSGIERWPDPPASSIRWDVVESVVVGVVLCALVALVSLVVMR